MSSPKGPYKKRPKPCVICQAPSIGVTGYVYRADGTNKIGIPFCQKHMDKSVYWSTPAFENQEAMARFRTEHPIIFTRRAAGKIPMFVNPKKLSRENTE